MKHHPPSNLPSHAAYPDSVADPVARLNVLLRRQLGLFAKLRLDLTVVETRLLILLGIYAPVSVNELASRSDLDRSQISRSLADLAERGLVAREPGSLDRRETTASLTAAGSQAHEQILTYLYRHNAALIDGISPTELAGYFKVMDLLIGRAQSLQDDRLD